MLNSIETIFLKVVIGNAKYVVGCIYRPPKSDLISFLERFEEILRVVKIDAPGSKVLLHGDFNINLLSCQSNRMSNEFLSSVLSNNLAVTVIKPTRVGATSATLIDNIFDDNSVNLKNSGVILSNISDHFSLFNIIKVESDSSEDNDYVEIQKRQMNEHNINCLNESICGYDWETIKQVTSAEDAYNMFSDKLTDLLNINCPYRKFKIKKLDVNKSYITSDIKTMIKEKHKLQKLYNRKPITYGDRYRKMRNSLNSVIRKAKADYFRTKIRNNTHNSRETWRVINSLLGTQGHVPLLKYFVDEDVIVSDPHDIAKGFNDYFANIGPMMASFGFDC